MATGSAAITPAPQIGARDSRPTLRAEDLGRHQACAASLGMERALHGFAVGEGIDFEILRADIEERGEDLRQLVASIPFRDGSRGLSSDLKWEALQDYAELVAERIAVLELDIDEAGAQFAVRALLARDEAIRIVADSTPGIETVRWNLQTRRLAGTVTEGEVINAEPEALVEFGTANGVVLLALDFRSGWAAAGLADAQRAAKQLAVRVIELLQAGKTVLGGFGGTLPPASVRGDGSHGQMALRHYKADRLKQMAIDVISESRRSIAEANRIAETEGFTTSANPGNHCLSCDGRGCCTRLHEHLREEGERWKDGLKAIAPILARFGRGVADRATPAEVPALAEQLLRIAGLASTDGTMKLEDLSQIYAALVDAREVAKLTDAVATQLDALTHELLAQGHRLPGIGLKPGRRQSVLEVAPSEEMRSEVTALWKALEPHLATGRKERIGYEEFLAAVTSIKAGELVKLLTRAGVGANERDRIALLESLEGASLTQNRAASSVTFDAQAFAAGTEGIIPPEALVTAPRKAAAPRV